MLVKDVYKLAKITNKAVIIVANIDGVEFPILTVLDEEIQAIRRLDNKFMLIINKKKVGKKNGSIKVF